MVVAMCWGVGSRPPPAGPGPRQAARWPTCEGGECARAWWRRCVGEWGSRPPPAGPGPRLAARWPTCAGWCARAHGGGNMLGSGGHARRLQAQGRVWQRGGPPAQGGTVGSRSIRELYDYIGPRIKLFMNLRFDRRIRKRQKACCMP